MTVLLTVDVSNIVDGQNIDAADVTLPISQLKTAQEDVLNGVQGFDQINVGLATEVTIGSGSVTVTRSHHRVDTESNASTDDLETIIGGVEGDVLYLRLENAARQVVVKHNIGNIFLSNGVDFTLDNADKTLRLFFNGSKWTDLIMPLPPVVDSVAVITPRTILGSATSSFSITSIPQAYSTLKLLFEFRTTLNDPTGAAFIRLNNDSTASNYYQVTGEQIPSLSASQDLGSSAGLSLSGTGANAPAGSFAVYEITIFKYTSTTDLRHIVFDGHRLRAASSGNVNRLFGALSYLNVGTAITTLDFLTQGAYNFVADTAFTLIGIK